MFLALITDNCWKNVEYQLLFVQCLKGLHNTVNKMAKGTGEDSGTNSYMSFHWSTESGSSHSSIPCLLCTSSFPIPEMPAHFNSSCCLSRKEIKPQVVFLCSKWPPGDGLKLIPCVACCASESRGYWVFSYFVPSKLCLENQGLLGSTQSLWTKYPQLIQTRGNWTVIGLDLTLFFFLFSCGWCSLFLFTSQGLFEVGYLFIYALLLS